MRTAATAGDRPFGATCGERRGASGDASGPGRLSGGLAGPVPPEAGGLRERGSPPGGSAGLRDGAAGAGEAGRPEAGQAPFPPRAGPEGSGQSPPRVPRVLGSQARRGAEPGPGSDQRAQGSRDAGGPGAKL